MIRSLLTVFSGTLASRLLGFARDSLIAALLGTGAVADAFLAAFQLVNVIRRLLTEGALNAALVPAWLRRNREDGAIKAAAFAGEVLGTLSAALVVATALLALAAPALFAVLTPGFVGQPTLPLAVTDARLMLPYLAFAGPSTVLLALATAQSRFALTAFSPLLFNGALILATAALLIMHTDATVAAMVLAATIGVAGLLQLAMLLLRGRDATAATPLGISFSAEMRAFFAAALPGMVTSAAPQLMTIGGALIASTEPSAVSWLYYANRLIELPLGIVGVAMGTVLVPELTHAIHADDRPALAHAQSRSLELAVGLALPAMLGLIVLSEPIVRLLFERGAFAGSDTIATAQVLGWLAAALPAQVLTKTLAPAFFAREDTRTPLHATLAAFVVGITTAFLIGRSFGAGGIAAGLAVGAWTHALVLIRRGAATFGFSIEPATRRRLPRIVLAATVMAGLLAATPIAPAGHGLVHAATLLTLIGCAIAIYAVLLATLGVLDWRVAVTALRRKPGRDLHRAGGRAKRAAKSQHLEQ